MMLHTQTIDQRREEIAFSTPAKYKSAYGQYMTPSVIAHFMAGMFNNLGGQQVRLLDAGAGIGSLTAAFAERATRDGVASLDCELWEIDSNLHTPLRVTMELYADWLNDEHQRLHYEIQGEDFILAFCDLFASKPPTKLTHAIINPPYKKINSKSAHRYALSRCGIETANLYSAFVALALQALEVGGELVAITPRSFCNGTYFRPFRELLLSKSALTKIHVFESRTQAFKGDEVLQENVIFHLVKGGMQGSVLLSSSEDAKFVDIQERVVPFDEVVLSGDQEKIIHISIKEEKPATAQAMWRYCHTLDEIGLSVSTGPVVDFRLREHLREFSHDELGELFAPMVYSHHFQDGFVVHPKLDAKRPNYIEVNDATRKWMLPTACYVVIRRLSSKEEKRRIVPAVLLPSITACNLLGLDNKTNVFHQAKHGLDEPLAKGLAVYLSSTFADQWLRRFSGHTQVNAGDLRVLRYPDIETLIAWGQKVASVMPSQEEVDAWVGGV